jgi:hypothetical protein
MILDKVFERFLSESPLTVMTRALMENALRGDLIDQMFEETAQEQYTDTLLFSQVVEVMGLVATGFFKSPHAVHLDHPELFPVCLKSFYDKIQGTEPVVLRRLVSDTAGRLGLIQQELPGVLTPLLPGYRLKILDGNALAGTQHRIKELRGLAAACLPGKTLAVLDPQLGLIIDVFPCEDGHAQERSLLPAVLETVQAGDLWLLDRNFCTADFICGVIRGQGHVLVREHLNTPVRATGPLLYKGRVSTGEVYEQEVVLAAELGADGQVLRPERTLRRLVIELDEPTRDGAEVVQLLTDVTEVDALVLAMLYLERWQLETAYQVLTVTLHCEQRRLGYPRAALLGFCVAVLAYNVLAVIKGALRSVHGEAEVEEKVSLHHLTEEVRRTHAGMMIAIPLPQWLRFRELSPQEMAGLLRELAGRVLLSRYKKAKTRPKKAKVPPRHDPQVPHVSTAQILAKRQR